MIIGVLSGGDGRSLSITSDSSFKSIQEVTMIEGKSLVRNGGDASIFFQVIVEEYITCLLVQVAPQEDLCD